MKFVAYGIPVLMVLPVVIWVVIQNAVIGGNANSSQLSSINWITLGAAGVAMLVTGFLLARMILNSNSKQGK
ncbi:MAG: hypothetical protein VR70_06125 [Rhodospirillaceae bacterium BRH_c57]|nr:MAG: hypothetical protein VR70_06125 [Rhodospirillaceae bacterium BRH_c57]